METREDNGHGDTKTPSPTPFNTLKMKPLGTNKNRLIARLIAGSPSYHARWRSITYAMRAGVGKTRQASANLSC